MPQAVNDGDIDHSVNRRPSHRLLYLDGWRGVCILAVLMGHFGPIHVLDFGSLGVEMFFVLSGRLMADILFIEKFPLRQFYIRRFSRVWPGLFVYVMFCAVIFYRVKGFLHVSAVAIIGALTFMTNYRVMIFGETQLLDHTWSLSVEEHSYIILGVFAFLFRNKSLSALKYFVLGLAILMATNGVLRTYVFPTQNIDFPGQAFDIYWCSDIRCASVFFAVFIYLHRKTTAALPARDHSKAALLLLTLGVVAFVSSVPEPVQFTIGTLCLAASVCAFEVSEEFQKIFSQKILMLFGTYSFSIYVWQQLFYKIFQDMRSTGALTRIERAIWRPVFVALACGAGVASYYFIERPARKYINERWAAPRARPGSVVSPAQTS
ncbi:MAG: hypothetical protein B7Z80_23445 [Rhodospirillales bacterium 20-64-7]|nr:MAG: hypothetical protein B7Z80_23445 [Rhodospirillales bacterium 20-64-7]